MKKTAITLFAIAMTALRLSAEPLRLASVFGDGMVLQRELPAPVWGWAPPGTPVEVQFAGQHLSTRAGDDGAWSVRLAPLEAEAEGRTLSVRAGDETTAVDRVLVGEVWIAAGQSNMVDGGPDRDTGLYPHWVSPNEPLPPVRIRRFGDGASLVPLPDADVAARGGRWANLNEPLEGNHSMSVYFARVLRDELRVPVGILLVAVGGTTQTAWMSREALESFPAEGHANYYEQRLAGALSGLKGTRRNPEFDTWEGYEQAVNAWLENPDRRGRRPGHGLVYVNFPTALHNTRIHPLAPLAIRGVIWHQGEAGPGGDYALRLRAMANDWRQLFGRDFHFIAGTLSRNTTHQPPQLPHTRTFYRSNLNLALYQTRDVFADDPAFALVEIYDTGNSGTHFAQKAEAGRRMGLAALAKVHGRDELVFTGPSLVKVESAGNSLILEFDHTAGELRHEPSLFGISGIFLMGRDANPRWAQVRHLGGGRLEISHPEIPEPLMAAYGVSPNPHETIFNAAGLPASGFLHNPAGLNFLRAPSGPPLVTLSGADSENANLQLTHVRQNGYILRIRAGQEGAERDLQIRARVPDTWREPVVYADGQRIPHQADRDETSAAVRFTPPVSAGRLIIVDREHLPAFEGIDRF